MTRVSADCVGPEDATLSLSVGTEVDVMSSLNLFYVYFSMYSYILGHGWCLPS